MMARKRIIVVGAGGFAREVRWLLEEIDAVDPTFEFVGYVVSDLKLLGAHDSRDEVVGDTGWLRQNRNRFDGLAIGIGMPAARGRVATELLSDYGADAFPPLIHPNVRFDRHSCRVGAGSLLCAGVTATVNVVFEPFALVNLDCTLGHESVVGRASVLNPSVNLSGGVTIGPGVLVGTGAQVLQYVSVGEGATIGAGAVVVKDVPAGVTVVGIPAKPFSKGKA